jgi:hypothetical protein
LTKFQNEHKFIPEAALNCSFTKAKKKIAEAIIIELKHPLAIHEAQKSALHHKE